MLGAGRVRAGSCAACVFVSHHLTHSCACSVSQLRCFRPDCAVPAWCLSACQEEELSRQRRREAAEATRAAERHAAQQKRDEESTEKLQLLVALRTARKTKADEMGQVGGCDPDFFWVCVGGPAQCFLAQQLLVEACMHRASSKIVCTELRVINTAAAATAVVSFAGAGCAGE